MSQNAAEAATNPYASPPDLTREDQVAIALAGEFDDDSPLAAKINISAMALQFATWMRIAIELTFALCTAVMGLILLSGTGLVAAGPSLAGFALSSLSLWVDFQILRGVKAMEQRRNYAVAQRAGWLTLLPISPIVLFHWPFGVWVLCVLGERDVREVFGRD